MKFKLVIKRPQKDQICHIWTLKRQFGNPGEEPKLGNGRIEQFGKTMGNIIKRSDVIVVGENKSKRVLHWGVKEGEHALKKLILG